MTDRIRQLDEIVDECLSGIFGPNKEAFLLAQNFYQDDVRRLQERHRRVTEAMIRQELDSLTFGGGSREAMLGVALQNTEQERLEMDEELRQALIAAKEEFQRRVSQLLAEDQR